MNASTVILIAFFTSAATATAGEMVPELAGLTEADARANAAAANIALFVAGREPTPGRKPGTVVRQSIPAGQRANLGWGYPHPGDGASRRPVATGPHEAIPGP